MATMICASARKMMLVTLVPAGKQIFPKFTGSCSMIQPRRNMTFAFLDGAWNKVDEARIKEVGPEKAAAEWLMRCGAAVKFRGQERFLADYNAMELSSPPNMKIEGIDATNSCIMAEGFPYLKGLTAVKSVKFDKTHHIDNRALDRLSYIEGTLEDLEIISCGNVTDSGITELAQLKKLRKLYLFDLPGVKKPDQCVQTLKSKLPQCQIKYDPPRK